MTPEDRRYLLIARLLEIRHPELYADLEERVDAIRDHVADVLDRTPAGPIRAEDRP